MKKLLLILRYAVGIPAFILSAYLTNAYEEFPIGSILFFLCLIFECIGIFAENGTLLDLRFLFSLSWLGGIALSALRLSVLQSPWSLMMWISSGSTYFLLLAGYDLTSNLIARPKRKVTTGVPVIEEEIRFADEKSTREQSALMHLFQAIVIVFSVCFLAFLIECVKFRFVLPILNDVPHAYTDFHITGIHYFVVSICFVHPLSVIYLMKNPKAARVQWWLLLIMNVIAILIPVVLLSKFQLAIAVILPIFTWIILQKKIPGFALLCIILAAIAVLFAAFIYMMSMRHYPEGYLEGIFQFKNRRTSLLIQYPYIYIVNNFENLNLMTMNLEHFTYGLRSGFPAAALTGLKFVSPIRELLEVPQFVTIEELTTRTLIYDWYGDFGIPGVMVFSLITGVAASLVHELCKRKTVLGILLFIQFAIYLSLAFFQTWFSIPTTWFWFVVSVAVAVWCTKQHKEFRFSLRDIVGDKK